MNATIPAIRPRRGRAAWLLAPAALVAVALASWTAARPAPAIDLASHPRARVRRATLHATVRAPGRVESSRRTLIECETEALVFSGQRGSFVANGSTTILSLIPDGSTVAKGDVLCELDSSDYQELVRQQQIEVDRSRADYEAARLDLESEEIALREYRDGLLKQAEEANEGRITLLESEIQKQNERVAWAVRMAEIGYIPPSRLAAERATLQRNEVELRQAVLTATNLENFGAPKNIITLQSRIDGARSVLTYQQLRLSRNENRLAHFRRQVELCTVRAPHDGFVIYANENDGDTRIEPGARVRQKQDLFFLPDLTRMEVQTLLHQSVVDRVRDGQPARVRLEALSDMRLEGHVVAVAPLPDTSRRGRYSEEVKNFIGRVKLDAIPEGIRPGMTAEVEVLTASKPDSLVIPAEALAVEGGQDICYVVGPDGPARRVIEIGTGTPDLLEVRAGLADGEEVLLDPEQIAELIGPDAEHPAEDVQVAAHSRPAF